MVRVVAAETGQLGDVRDGDWGNFREEAEFYVPIPGLENDGGQIFEQFSSPSPMQSKKKHVVSRCNVGRMRDARSNFKPVGGTHKSTHGKQGKR